MAPAALDTLVTHLQDTGRKPSYYDAIITGDLGYIGKEILQEMAQTKGYNINANYDDCGVLMFDKKKQDTHSGGSGCACIATVFSGYFYKQLKEKKMKKNIINCNRGTNEFNKYATRRNNTRNCTRNIHRNLKLGDVEL